MLLDLGVLPGQDYSGATAINSSDEIVGYSGTVAGGNRAFVYVNGTMLSLGTLGGSNSEAFGINGSGQIVGDSSTSTGDFHAFLYSNGIMTDLGVLPGTTSSVALGINSQGDVVGRSDFGGTYSRAFFYSNGTMVNLGSLYGGPNSYSDARAVNSSGQVVGTSFSNTGPQHAFLYNPGPPGGPYTGLYDLNSLLLNDENWDLYQALAINDGGQIVGSGSYNGSTHAFLLTPTNIPGPSVVPEPPTALTGLIGAVTSIGFWVLSRRRCKLV
jgi:probable HAF family extracellular repeat protein